MTNLAINDHLETVVVDCRITHYDVYIGRKTNRRDPFDIGFGNPFTHLKQSSVRGLIHVFSRKAAVDNHMLWLQRKYKGEVPFKKPTLEQIMSLKGKCLGCYCAPQSCHGDNFLLIIERGYI